jgi:ankyrin repeat protein
MSDADNTSYISQLLQRGCNPNVNTLTLNVLPLFCIDRALLQVTNNYRQTPLHIAARLHMLPAVILLLEHGGNAPSHHTSLPFNSALNLKLMLLIQATPSSAKTTAATSSTCSARAPSPRTPRCKPPSTTPSCASTRDGAAPTRRMQPLQPQPATAT